MRERDKENTVLTTEEAKDLASRLAASKEEGDKYSYDKGHEVGVDWARCRASRLELESLHSATKEWGVLLDPWGEFGHPGYVYNLIHPMEEDHETCEEERVRGFWRESVAIHFWPNQPFLKGFCDGACRAFREAEEKRENVEMDRLF